ncbi:MAG: DUF2760 domain-containing protein [Planctomycetota bacterium]
MRLILAIQAFFRTLFNADFAASIRPLFDSGVTPVDATVTANSEGTTVSHGETPTRAAGRSEAITLLATLQREARFVDLAMEPLGDFSDAQVGAAARDVLQDCRKTLERLFELQPTLPQAEGETVEVPKSYDVARFRLTGAVSGDPPFSGKLAHPGWTAARCELPQWSGGKPSALVVAPAEVEVG